MEEEKFRQLIEEIDPEEKIPLEKIDELIATIKEQELHPLKNGDKVGDVIISIGGLKEQLEIETDWRKRAAIAAKIISIDLDN